MPFFYLQIGSGQGISEIYSFGKNTPNYGKTSGFLQYNSSTTTVYYLFDAYNADEAKCEVINVPDASIVERRDFRRGCLRLDDYVMTEGDSAADTRFISQDASKYFWWFICLEGSVRSFNACTKGFFNLNILRNFGVAEIDLSGLPWDKIAEDLEDFTGLQFDDVKNIWLGKDCVA